MTGMRIAFDDRIELENAKTVNLRLLQTIFNQLLADMPATAFGVHRITGIGDMSASSYIIGMENIESDQLFPFIINRHATVRLGCEKASSCLHIKKIFLRKGDPLFNDLIPQRDHSG